MSSISSAAPLPPPAPARPAPRSAPASPPAPAPRSRDRSSPAAPGRSRHRPTPRSAARFWLADRRSSISSITIAASVSRSQLLRRRPARPPVHAGQHPEHMPVVGPERHADIELEPERPRHQRMLLRARIGAGVLHHIGAVVPDRGGAEPRQPPDLAPGTARSTDLYQTRLVSTRLTTATGTSSIPAASAVIRSNAPSGGVSRMA